MNRFSSRIIILALPISLSLSLAAAGFLASTIEYRPWGVPEILLSEYDEKLAKISFTNDVKSGSYRGPLPSVHQDSRQKDFGSVVSGAELQHVFKLQNFGNSDLKLTEVAASDSLEQSVVQWKLTPKVVVPGEEASLSAIWNTATESSKAIHHFRIDTNDPLRRSISFALLADIRQPCVVPEEIAAGAHDFGNAVTCEFLVTSETSRDLVVEKIDSSLPNFEWFVEDDVPASESIADNTAKVAHNVIVRFVPSKYGPINEGLTVTMSLEGRRIERYSMVTGNVRSPITFAHPELHSSTGLNIGTVISDKPFEVAVAVRQRSPQVRELKVLDYYPKELDVSLIPSQRIAGSYKLAIKVPQGSPTMVFNLKSHQGYVSVGDPNDKEFSSWFPLLGAVVHSSK